jgi:hypothetical protein
VIGVARERRESAADRARRPHHEARLEPGQVIRATRGQPGREVAVYRVHHRTDESCERTLISRDSYPTLNRVMKVAAGTQ